jgi:surface antigen
MNLPSGSLLETTSNLVEEASEVRNIEPKLLNFAVNATQNPTSFSESVEEEISLVSENSVASQNSPLIPPPEIKVHVVKKGETLAVLAQEYNISQDTIKSVNNLNSLYLKEGQELKILPISGVLHKINAQDTLENISKKYGVSKESILKYNKVTEEEFKTRESLIIPGAKMPSPRPLYRSYRPSLASTTSTQVSNGETTQGFYYGYCTEWAAKRAKELGTSPVTWRGNGSAWANNAQKSGRTVDKNPEVGSIVATHEGGSVGHVGVVEKVDPESRTVTISEKNYAGWNVVSQRTISIDDPVVQGFIH